MPVLKGQHEWIRKAATLTLIGRRHSTMLLLFRSVFVFFFPPSWKPHYGVRLISSIHASHEALWTNNKQPHIDFKTCMKNKKKKKYQQCTQAWARTLSDSNPRMSTRYTHTRVESDVMLCASFFCWLLLRSMQVDLLDPSIHLFKHLAFIWPFFFL